MFPHRSLKHVAAVAVSNVDKKSVEGDHPVRLVNYTDVYYGDRITPALPLMGATATTQQLKTFRLQPGDVIITKDSETAEDIGTAAYIEESAPDVVLGYHLALLRPAPSAIEPRFLYWCISSKLARGQLSAGATGITRFGLRRDVIASIWLPMPSLGEQRAIADYLDAETTRIDALIAKKRRMIQLLDARDVSLAHYAISGRGLPGDRVATGLPWLGPAPVDWPIAPVYSQFDVTLGRMLNADRLSGSHAAPYIRNINVRWDNVDVSDIAAMDFPPSERAKYRLRYGDLLINEGGAGVGRAAIWRNEVAECYFQKSVLRLRPISYSLPEWMLECMRVVVDRAVPMVEGNLATIPHLPAETLRAYRLPFPSADVQRKLLAWLRDQRSRTRPMRARIDRQIALLQEHRQALITAAVTGEIDVPGVAA